MAESHFPFASLFWSLSHFLLVPPACTSAVPLRRSGVCRWGKLGTSCPPHIPPTPQRQPGMGTDSHGNGSVMWEQRAMYGVQGAVSVCAYHVCVCVCVCIYIYK